jgi:hypothetical protein
VEQGVEQVNAKAQGKPSRQEDRDRAGWKKKLGETGTPTMEVSSHRAGLATGAL